MAMSNAKASKPQIWTLEKCSELRFEVLANSELVVTLKSGSAELFGTELKAERVYRFKRRMGAIYTWYGCTLETSGTCKALYQSSDTPMASIADIHGHLDADRAEALSMGMEASRVAIVGPSDSGKSSLAQILLGYAVRTGHTPIFVELDVCQGQMVVPGTIAATPVDQHSLNVEMGTDSQYPVAFFYGHQSASHISPVYSKLVTRMSDTVRRRIEASEARVKASGVLVNTVSWVDGEGYEVLKDTITRMLIDIVLVVGHDRLFNDLKRDMLATNVMKVPRSGGVVRRSQVVRKRETNHMMRQYFYGHPLVSTGVLEPASIVVQFQEIEVYTAQKHMEVSEAFVPVGRTSTIDQSLLRRVTSLQELTHGVMAVMHARSGEEVINSQASVAGFVHVTKVEDVDGGRVTLLAPSASALPSHFFVLGSVKWLET